jgi:drug/metabolite transporter (DMT)-like permease
MIVVAWIVFMAASVGGHLALTQQTRAMPLPDSLSAALRFAVAPWTLLCICCWALSTLLWVGLLQRHGLLKTSSVSSLRYALIAVAAVLVFKEHWGARDVAGAALIAGGVLLVAR